MIVENDTDQLAAVVVGDHFQSVKRRFRSHRSSLATMDYSRKWAIKAHHLMLSKDSPFSKSFFRQKPFCGMIKQSIYMCKEKKNMNAYELKYGCNPNQTPARIYMENGAELPVKILNGRPGYINFLDALNAWQLVSELKAATGEAAAASFKHVSPTSAALGRPMSEALKKSCFVDDIPGLDDSPLALAYARARGTDRMSSFGDFAALSDVCDETTARILSREVSDGVIAPGYTPEAFKILSAKKGGKYNIIEMDPSYKPAPLEHKTVFGITFEQGRNELAITPETFANVVTENKALTDEVIRDMIVSLITLKYTQSNSVCFAIDGQTIGVGAGQQSRIHCTRLAASKADLWWLRQSDKVLNLEFADGLKRPDKNNVIDLYLSADDDEVLAEGKWQQYFKTRPERFTEEEKKAYLAAHATGVTLGSDAFFPFSDNIERGAASGVSYVVQPGGSLRDDVVIDACNAHNMVMCFTGIRLFHH
ncbi:MAG: phosphoribosylaminoimidazolecarboxamide formyltransferase [Lachnospiraceae bacterium]|nr:phosphoribosylaminoimidazolecarboxamide formyltransferase [Lachnospiraceae bacterium]